MVSPCFGLWTPILVYAGRKAHRISGLDWKFFLILGLIGLAVSALMCLAVVKLLQRREPYATFMRLRLRAKLTFLRLLAFDPRLPWYVRALPLLALAYWISPIDLIPGFMADDIAFTLMIIMVIIRLTPRELIADLLRAADASHPAGQQD